MSDTGKTRRTQPLQRVELGAGTTYDPPLKRGERRLSEADILARLAELPASGTLFRHHSGDLVQVVGASWQSERDVPVVKYRHVDRETLTSPPHPNLLYDHRALSGPEFCHDYTAEGWLRVEPDGRGRFEEVEDAE